jgi:hypothetical protein
MNIRIPKNSKKPCVVKLTGAHRKVITIFTALMTAAATTQQDAEKNNNFHDKCLAMPNSMDEGLSEDGTIMMTENWLARLSSNKA